MKRFLLLFYGFLVMHVFAQEVKTQKDILQLPNTDLVKDFNLKIGNGKIKPIAVSKSTYIDYGYGRVGNKFNYALGNYISESLTFKDDFLLKKVDEFKFGDNFIKPKRFETYYTYKNGLLKNQKNSSFYNEKLESVEETIYIYTRNGTLKESKYTSQGKTTITKYKSSTNTITNDFYNGKQSYFLKNGLITKKVTFNKSANKTYTNSYQYNDNGFLVNQNLGKSTDSYQLNKNNLTEKEIKKNYTKHFIYNYDKYGNWVIAYQLTTSVKDYDGNKTKRHLYGSTYSFYIRELKYSNGEITGSINLEDGKTKTAIIKMRRELYNSLIEATVSFRKTANSRYLFMINGQEEAINSPSFFMGKSILVFHKPSKKLFIFEDFEDKPEGKDFTAKKTEIDIKNGYWFKTEKGSVHVFRNDGTYIKKISVYKFTLNKKDVIFKGENEPNQIVLENFTSVKINTPYSVTLYANYKPTGSDNMTEKAKKLKKSMDKYSEFLLGDCVNGDCKNGYGEQKLKDGRKADGFFKNGKPYGPIHLSDKKSGKSILTVYKGSFQNQKGFWYEYNGDNLMIFTNHSKNIGFYNNYKTKQTYKMNFSNGKIISKKELSNNNSSTCVVGNCTNGIGIYEYGNSTYMGTFKNSKRDGFGMLFFKSGGDYIGEFLNGSYHGLGTYTISEFDYYMGFYQNGKAHGQGVWYHAKNTYDAGNWINGQLEGKKTTLTKSTNSSSNLNSSTATTATNFSEEQKNTFLACKNDAVCAARNFKDLDTQERKNVSGTALTKKMTDYYHDLYKMNPKLAYDMLFKINISLINIKLLPQTVQKDLKSRAQKLSDAYQKHKRS